MQLTHYVQLHLSHKFCRYDYRWNNLEVYNTTTPTDYDVGKIVAPVYLYHGAEDLLIAEAVRMLIWLCNIYLYLIIRMWKLSGIACQTFNNIAS